MKRKLNCVLLIDDDEPTNYLNELIIQEADVAESIVSVQSAKQGLELLQRQDNASHLNPDLIFLDINMPAMNGWEFIDHYKRMSLIHNRKVIVMLTASINQDDQIRAMSISEISDFMNKPLSQILLEELIKKHFPTLI
jgi:CheY-like chemotaxis protein